MEDTAERASNRASMVFGGIWLLFLISPITALVMSDAPTPWRVVGGVSTTLFAVGYLLSYLYPAPAPLGQFGGAAAWTGVLGLLAVATIPAIGAYALTFLAYLVAISVFRLPRPWDAIGALVPTAAAIGLLVLLSDPRPMVWELPMTLIPLVLMLPIRRVTDSLEHQSALRHQLSLSRQREQLGRDVHDILGHSLTVIAVKTELAGKLLERDPARVREELADVLELARSALQEVRSTVTQLQAPHLLPQLAAAAAALDAAGIKVERPAAVADLDDADSQLLAWCLREAVTNVVRHSGASHCTISVTATTLTVTDDGRGCGDAVEGNGLRGMRQRVSDAGGTMVVSDFLPEASASGTRVEVAL